MLTNISSTAAQTDGIRYIMQGNERSRALDKYHLILAPTHACNLRCGHCYLHDHDADTLPKDIALRIVDEWAALVTTERGRFQGIFHIKGGEPFVVPYIHELFNRVVESSSLELMITTNGTILSAKAKAALKRAAALGKRFTAIVSIDGSESRTHDFLRGEGNFATSIAFLNYIEKLGISIHFNSVLYRKNLHQIGAIVDLAKSVGAAQVNFLPFVSKGFGERLVIEQLPQVDAFRALKGFYDDAPPETQRMLIGSAPDLLKRESDGVGRLSHECVAAYRGLFYIKPDGSAYTCPNIENSRYSIGNVRTSTLLELSDRLDALHTKLRSGRSSDMLLCVGEAILYENRRDWANVASLAVMQNEAVLERGNHATRGRLETKAYCVSRNF